MPQLTGVFLGVWIHRSPVHSGTGCPSFSCCVCRCAPTTLCCGSQSHNSDGGFSRLATCVLCRVQMWFLSPTSILHDLFPSWVARALLFARAGRSRDPAPCTSDIYRGNKQGEETKGAKSKPRKQTTPRKERPLWGKAPGNLLADQVSVHQDP